MQSVIRPPFAIDLVLSCSFRKKEADTKAHAPYRAKRALEATAISKKKKTNKKTKNNKMSGVHIKTDWRDKKRNMKMNEVNIYEILGVF